MSPQSPPPPPPPPPRDQRPPTRSGLGSWPRWSIWVLLGVVAAALLLPSLFSSSEGQQIDYTTFLTQVQNDNVKSIEWNNNDGHINGQFDDGAKFTTTGVPSPPGPSDDDRTLFADHHVQVTFKTPQSSIWGTLLPLLLPIVAIGALFVWLQRRQASQMGGIMSIGRSRARTYNTERPGTTFSDVAGYDGVKQEIREVVDFLKFPDKFGEIGARIPKGVLLVGPPGTGKTLIARAVAGEAGVPFLSVSGSDFMEMFVGVGASRVRDLFQTARKLGRAIIFVDEIDSIGRKRGAGLGGGHDEREQTLNQMLNEMDGFEATEGIVMMAATNRPDILDPALLRPGRFDRQVVVPLPEIDERLAILKVHSKSKRLADDVDMHVVARGTPGMSGADLANLVNEAALFAVRAGDESIHMRHFEMARDRVLMGQRRESMALSDSEKEAVAYHEAGHAVCAAVLPHADPVHKVTILPTGMALGVTQQLPIEERHIYRQDYIEDRLVVAMGGRIAEDTVYGVISTGANNDLVMSTELARKMVREWGMSSRIGPMAWGSQGQVFLGEDLMHTRDYSDETARVIDEEVEKILREQEDRCRVVLGENRHGLDLVARALMEHETIDGDEVRRLIDIGRTGAPIESVVTRGADETRFSQPSAVAASGNGGNGVEEPSPAPAITNTPPN
ncbi:MAG TPA: ATP-dependent zinc metalloprotease FtsH [Acidimicrobiales bacterium]|jgi:cell division protease FtsH|nr:ATP-dependent zinc metalloprotease FtsH [Acidimicrobiales bacterium]